MFYKKLKTICKTAAISLLVAIAFLAGMDISTLSGKETLNILGEDLSYYKGSGKNAVLILGYDKQMVSAILPVLKNSELSIMWANPPANGEESIIFSAAIEELTSRSGVSQEEILLISVGEASQDLIRWYFEGEVNPLTMVLISPIADAKNLLDSGIYSCSYPRNTKTLVLQSVTASADQVDNAVELYNLLSGDTIMSNGGPARASKANASLIISPGTVISDLPASIQMLNSLSGWLSSSLSIDTASTNALFIKSILWLVAFVSLGVFLFASMILSREKYQSSGYQVITTKITHHWKFYLSRISVCLLSVVPALAIYIAMLLISSPIGDFGRVFLSYITGCGITIRLMYHYNIMLGVKGTPTHTKPQFNLIGVLKSLAICACVVLSLGVIGVSGFFGTSFSIERWWFFLAAFAALNISMLSFSLEAIVIDQFSFNKKILYSLILFCYLPLLVLPVIAVLMGQLPMAIAIAKCTFVLLYAIILSRITENISGSPRLASMAAALVLAFYISFNTFI